MTMNGRQDSNQQIVAEDSSFTWVGLDVEDCHVESLIGEGAFSWVYRGSTADGGGSVFKVAKPEACVGVLTSEMTQVFPTRAVVQMTGSYGDAQVSASDLLVTQARRLQSSSHDSLLKIESVTAMGELCYYRYQYLPGKTLRQLIINGEAGLDILLELAQSLSRIESESDFGAHGDLKPDNIIVDEGTIKLIDPGYFGSIRCLNGITGDVAITTPAYYPTLSADDLFAFGVIAWEALVGQHPLTGSVDSTETTAEALISPQLLDYMRAREFTGNYFGSRLLKLRNPADSNSNISQALGVVLLKMLRLKIDQSDKLAMCDGYATFAEIVDQLKRLMQLQDQ